MHLTCFKMITYSKKADFYCDLFSKKTAIVARKHNPIIIEFCKRVVDRSLAEMAIVLAAMRKLLHIVFGVLKNQTPFDHNYGKQFIF